MNLRITQECHRIESKYVSANSDHMDDIKAEEGNQYLEGAVFNSFSKLETTSESVSASDLGKAQLKESDKRRV